MAKTIAATYTTGQSPTYAADNPLTIASTGTITTSSGYALSLSSYAGWYALNQGLVIASGGNALDMESGTLVNQGAIAGSSHGVWINGVSGPARATVQNSGTIGGGVSAAGSYASLYLSNASGGVIRGASNGYAVSESNNTLTVVNAGSIEGKIGVALNGIGDLIVKNSGTIIGDEFAGVFAFNGSAYISNAAGGTIESYFAGVSFANAGGTLINAGTIAHGAGGNVAVEMADGAAATLVVEPGAVFVGQAVGNANDALIFASGASAGTFSGLGSHYTGFGSYTIGYAFWAATGTNVFGALTVTGHLYNSGVLEGGLVLYGGQLTNSGTIVQSLAAPAIAGTSGHVWNYGVILDDAGSYAVSVTNNIFVNRSPGTVAGVGGITDVGPNRILYEAGLISASGTGSAIYVGAGATVYVSGTVLASSGYAVKFAGASPNNELQLYGHYGPVVFAGTVDGAGGTLFFDTQLGALNSTYTLDATAARFEGFAAATVNGVNGNVWQLLGYTASGIFVDSGTIVGGLTEDASAAVTVEAGGTLSAGGGALVMLGGYAANAGQIEAGTDAVSIYGAATLTNSGNILDGGGGFDNAAIYIKVGGASVDNQAGGTISANYTGILDESDVLSLNNAGTIISADLDAVYGNNGLNITNTGVIIAGSNDVGVDGRQGNVDVTNAAGGTIDGGHVGVEIGDYGGGTIINAGTIIGTNDAVYVDAPSDPFAHVVVDPGAVFLGRVFMQNTASSLEFAAGTSAGTLAGLGSKYVGFGQVSVDAGANWTASGSNTLASGYTLTDSGSLTLTTNVYGNGTIDLVGSQAELVVGSGVSVSPRINAYGGTVVVDPGAAFAAPVAGAAAATLEFAAGTSAGTFKGLGSQYVNFEQVSIDPGAHWSATGVNLVASGQTLTEGGLFSSEGPFTNDGYVNVTGSLSLNEYGSSFTNDGRITVTGGAHYALYITGGAVTNAATASIAGGANYAVYAYAGTVINAGTIAAASASGIAVWVGPGAAGAVVVDPGAVFVGTVLSGNTIGAAYTSTLEFAAGSSAGTFAGLGSQYVNFEQVSIDAGASWTASGSNTLASGYTLTDAGQLYTIGTFTNGGVMNVSPAGAVVYGTFANDGSVSVGNFYGLVGRAGALITNAATAAITGGSSDAVVLDSGATLINAGRIAGGKNGGAYTYDGGVVINQATGTLSGSGSGITQDGGTLINAGTVAAGSITGYAVSARGYASSVVVVDPGAVFLGTVSGGNTIGAVYTSTLEFASGSSAGTFKGLGSQYVNFAQVSIDAGAYWTASRNNTLASGYMLTDDGGLTAASNVYGSGTIDLAGGATLAIGNGVSVAPTITGLIGNTVLLEGVDATVQSYAAGQLTLSDGLTLAVAHAGAGSYSTGSFTASYADGNTALVACFASGTRITGAFGPVPVEALEVGDVVRTANGKLRPVRWIGHRRMDLRRHPRPHDVMPVRVRAGAFGPALPRRDLVLSPDHAVFVDGHLVPVRYLINGQSIVQETREAITYWHVELESHDVILAEGLGCETYLDTGNRHAFDGGEAVQLHPAFARDHALAIWQAAGCAPILIDPADRRLRRLHQRLLARAARGRAA